MMEIPSSLKHNTLSHTTSVLSQAFLKDPFQNYLLRTQLGLTDNDKDISIEQNEESFSGLLSAFERDGKALFVTGDEARGVASVWVFETPSRDDGDDEGVPEVVGELSRLARPTWQREFPDGRQVLHLVLVGNIGSSNREKGQKGASYVIREMISTASKEGIPVILEATSFKARDVYQRCGFEIVEGIVVGKGKANADGRLEKGGVGLPLTLMKYCS